MLLAEQHPIYCCGCLNVRVRTQPPASSLPDAGAASPGAEDDNFIVVYTGEEGIEVVRHPAPKKCSMTASLMIYMLG
jgi:hypothetical protein